MKRFRKIIYGASVIFLSMILAVLVYVLMPSAYAVGPTTTNPDDPTITYNYEIWDEKDYSKIALVKKNALDWIDIARIASGSRNSQVTVDLTVSRMSTVWHDGDPDNGIDASEFFNDATPGQSLYSYFDSKEIHEVLGVNSVTVTMGRSNAIASLDSSFPTMFGPLSSTPAVGSNVVLKVYATSNVSIKNMGWAIDLSDLGFTSNTSLSYPNEIKDEIKEFAEENNVDFGSINTATSFGTSAVGYGFGWETDGAAIPADTNFPVGAVKFATQNANPITIKMFSGNNNVNFTSGSNNYKLGVSPELFGEVDYTLNSSVPQVVLDDLTFNATNAASTYAASLTTTFAPGTTGNGGTYTLNVSSDIQSLDVTPTWSYTDPVSVKVNGVSVSTSGETKNLSTVPNSFTVTITAGTDTTTYTINVTKKNCDATITGLTIAGVDSGTSATVTPGTNSFTTSDLKFKDKSFTIQPTFAASSGVTATIGTSGLPRNTNTTILFTSDPTTVLADNFTITSTADTGDIKTYTLTVNREAAYTNDKASNVEVTIDGVLISSFDSTTQALSIDTTSAGYNSLFYTSGPNIGKMKYSATNQVMTIAITKLDNDRQTVTYTTQTATFNSTSATTNTVEGVIKSEKSVKDSSPGITFNFSVDRVGVSPNATASFTMKDKGSNSVPISSTTSNVYTYKLKSTDFNANWDLEITGFDPLAKLYWSSSSTYTAANEVTAPGTINVQGAMPTATADSTMYLTVVPESDQQPGASSANTKVYVIKTTLVSTDVSLASATISTETVVSTDTSKVSGTTWTFTNDVLYRSTGTSTFTLSIVGGKPTKQTYTIDGTSGTSKSITITSADATAGYKNVSVVVASTDDSTVSETYTIHVPVKNADHTLTMTGTVVYVDENSVATTLNIGGASSDFTYTAATNTYTLNAGVTIPYKIKDVTVNLVPDKNTTTLSGSYGYAGTPVAFTDNSPFTWHIENTTTSQTTPTLTYTVKTEANTTGVSGSLVVRVAAPQNGNLFDFDIIKANGTVENKPSTTTSTYSYTLTSSDYVNNKYSLSITVDPSNPLAKVYVTNSVANTAAITGVNDANLFSNLTNSFEIGPTHTIYIVCRSESGNNNIVTLNTATADQANNKIQNIEIFDTTNTPETQVSFSFSQTNPNPATIQVGFEVTQIRFEITKEASEANFVDPLIVNNKNLSVGVNQFEIQLKSATNVLGTKYTIKIERATGSSDAFFEALQVNTIDMYTVNNTNVYETYTKTASDLDIRLNRSGSTTVQVDYTLSTGAKIVNYSSNISNNPKTQGYALVNVTPGTKETITLDIQSQFNSVEDPTNYRRVTINIFKANDTIAITSVDINDQTGSSAKDIDGNYYTYSSTATSPINFNVPYTTTSIEFAVLSNSNDHISYTFNPAGTTHILTAGNTKTITLNLKSEYAALGPTNIPTNQEKDIVYKIKRENAKTIDTLKEIKVTVFGGNSDGTDLVKVFTPDSDGDGVDENAGPFAVANIVDTATSYKIEYVKADTTENVNIASGVTDTLSLSSTGTTSVQKTISVQSEDTTRAAHNYRIDLSLQPIVYDSVNTLDDLVATATVSGSTKTYLDNTIATADKQKFEQTQYDYAISNIAATVANVTVSFTKTSNKSKVYYQIGTGTISSEMTSNTISNIALTEGANTKITIIVKAEDTTVTDKKYSITFSRPIRSTDAKATKIYVNGTEIDGFNPENEGEYTVNVPNTVTTVELDYVLSSLLATVAANGAPVGANTPLNVGDNHLTLTVKAENDTYVKNYRVNVVRDAISTVSDISITATNPTDPTSPVIPIAITDPTDPTSLIPDPTNPTGQIPYDATQVTISGTPAPGVTIQVTYPNPGFDPTLPVNPTTNPQTLTTTVTPNPANPTAPVNVTIPVPEGSSPITITTIPQSGAGNGTTYTTTVARTPGRTGNYLVTYTKEDGSVLTVTTTTNEYVYVLPRTKTYFEPVLTISDGASLTFKGMTYTANETGNIQLSSQLLNLGAKNEYEFVVTSETGISNDYKIIVYSAEQNKDITSVDVYKILSNGTHTDKLADKDDSNKVIAYGTNQVDSINVANVISNAWLKVVKSGSYSKIKVNGTDYAEGSQLLAVGENTFTITVTSEYGVINPAEAGNETTTFVITINRGEPDTDATVKKLEIQVGGQTYAWDHTLDDGDITTGGNHSYEFIKEDIGDTAASLTIVCEPNSSLSTVSGQTGTQTLQQVSVTNGNPTGYIFTFTVQVTSESGNVNTYTIKVSRGPLDINDDNSITNIIIKDSNGNEYIGQQEYNENTTSYTVGIPFILGATKYDIIVEKLNVSNSTITVTNATGANSTFIKTIPSIMTEDMVTTHTIYATSHNSARGTEYTVIVTVKSPSHEARLSEIKFNGVIIDSFNPDTTVYTMPLQDSSVNSISLEATLMDPLATITAASQFDESYKELSLSEGNNTYTITVVAQDGKTSKTYQVRVARDYPLPELTDLTVDGYPLLDAQYNAKEFNKEITEYYVIIPNSTYNGTITATAENEKYTVSCSGVVSLVGTKSRIFSVSFNKTQTTSEAKEGGKYDFNISLTSPAGKTNLYVIHVQRRSIDESNTNLTGISLMGRETKSEFLPSTEFNNNLTEYSIIIPNKVRNLDVNAVTEKVNGHSATVAVYNNENLTVGKNEIILFITAEDGTTRAVLVHVEREENEFDMEVKEIAQVKQDFADSNLGKYTVPSTVGKLNITVTNHDKSDIGTVSYVVSNGGVLQPGENEVSVLITAADGTTTVETLNVTRTPMKFNVVLDATNFKTTKVANTDYKYAIELGTDKDVTAIDDYKKYISWDKTTDDLVVEVLTDLTDKNTNEVILKVSTKDGIESQLVSFQLNKTVNDSIFNFANTSNIILWIIIILAIIILIIILISVNREKYGKVNKNRKK